MTACGCRDVWVAMHQRNGWLLFIPVVSYIFDVWMDRSNKDIIPVKHSFTVYLENTPLSYPNSLLIISVQGHIYCQ